MVRHTICLLVISSTLFLYGSPGSQATKLNWNCFEKLEDKASNVVDVSLNRKLLQSAGSFFSSEPQDAQIKEVLAGIKGIYVKIFTLDSGVRLIKSDLKPLRNQIETPEWNRIVYTKDKQSKCETETYVQIVDGKNVGLSMIVQEPENLVVVYIEGNIDLEKLLKLQGQFGIPSIDSNVVKENGKKTDEELAEEE